MTMRSKMAYALISTHALREEGDQCGGKRRTS